MYGDDGGNSLMSSYVKCLVQNLAVSTWERLHCGRQCYQVVQGGLLEPPLKALGLCFSL